MHYLVQVSPDGQVKVLLKGADPERLRQVCAQLHQRLGSRFSVWVWTEGQLLRWLRHGGFHL